MRLSISGTSEQGDFTSAPRRIEPLDLMEQIIVFPAIQSGRLYIRTETQSTVLISQISDFRFQICDLRSALCALRSEI